MNIIRFAINFNKNNKNNNYKKRISNIYYILTLSVSATSAILLMLTNSFNLIFIGIIASIIGSSLFFIILLTFEIISYYLIYKKYGSYTTDIIISKKIAINKIDNAIDILHANIVNEKKFKKSYIQKNENKIYIKTKKTLFKNSDEIYIKQRNAKESSLLFVSSSPYNKNAIIDHGSNCENIEIIEKNNLLIKL